MLSTSISNPSPENPGHRKPNSDVEIAPYCQQHVHEAKLKMIAEQENWPLVVDWDDFQNRVLSLSGHVLDILANPGALVMNVFYRRLRKLQTTGQRYCSEAFLRSSDGQAQRLQYASAG